MKRQERPHTAIIPSGGECRECGKAKYPTRKDAKAAARRFHPGAHLRAYRCGDSWHYGHVNTTAREYR